MTAGGKGTGPLRRPVSCAIDVFGRDGTGTLGEPIPCEIFSEGLMMRLLALFGMVFCLFGGVAQAAESRKTSEGDRHLLMIGWLLVGEGQTTFYTAKSSQSLLSLFP